MENQDDQYFLLRQAEKKQKTIYNWIWIAGILIVLLLISNLFIPTSVNKKSIGSPVAAMQEKLDSLKKENIDLDDSLKIMKNNFQMIETSIKMTHTQNVYIFSDKSLEYSGEFRAKMEIDEEGKNYEIQLDKAPNFNEIEKVLYLWGNGEAEQISSTRKSFQAQFETKHKIEAEEIKVLIFYRNGTIIVWEN